MQFVEPLLKHPQDGCLNANSWGISSSRRWIISVPWPHDQDTRMFMHVNNSSCTGKPQVHSWLVSSVSNFQRGRFPFWLVQRTKCQRFEAAFFWPPWIMLHPDSCCLKTKTHNESGYLVSWLTMYQPRLTSLSSSDWLNLEHESMFQILCDL